MKTLADVKRVIAKGSSDIGIYATCKAYLQGEGVFEGDDMYVNDPETMISIRPDADEEIQNRVIAFAGSMGATPAWVRARKEAYGDPGEQLGMLYDDMKKGTTTWLDMQDAVKERIPK